jgi:hypothetical protein
MPPRTSVFLMDMDDSGFPLVLPVFLTNGKIPKLKKLGSIDDHYSDIIMGEQLAVEIL